MKKSLEVNVLRVFTDENHKFGNPVGIVMDEEREFTGEDRQRIATKLGFSETVFINDSVHGEVSLFNPTQEVYFAGHALVGTAYFITSVLSKPIGVLVCRKSQISIKQDGDMTWIRTQPVHLPPWDFQEVGSTSNVEGLSSAEIAQKKHTVVWAWIDKEKGVVRARTFAPDWGIPEDEANGSGAMLLTNQLNRSLTIHHGKGSVIFTRLTTDGLIDLGGRVVEGAPLYF